MNLLPRTGSYLIDSMLFTLGAICFTLAVGLVVLVGALLIQATLLVTQPYTGSRSVSSVLALFVFATYVGVPSYLIATYADDPEGRVDQAADDPESVDERETTADRTATGDRTVADDRGEGPRREDAPGEDGPGEEPRREEARCDGARPEGERNDRRDGEGL